MTTTVKQTQRHTPPPWRVSEIEGCRVIDGHDVIIAATGLVKLSNWPRTIYEEQANARLIAAAPELVDSLREVSLLLNVSPLKELATEPWAVRLRALLARIDER